MTDYQTITITVTDVEEGRAIISSVTSTLDDGIYGIGETIPISVIFDKEVVVTGTPSLTLKTGTADANANYTSGSGSDTLVFNYTVVSGHSSIDLEYLSTSALILSPPYLLPDGSFIPCSIKDMLGLSAILTLPGIGSSMSLGGNKNIVLDYLDGSSSICTKNDDCQSEYCDACGECGGNNPTFCIADGLGCGVADQCQADYCDLCGICGGDHSYVCYEDGVSCTVDTECSSDNCDLCGKCGSVNSCVPQLTSMPYFSGNILPLNTSPLEFTFSMSLADTSTRAISVSSSLQNTNMSSVITLKNNNTIKVEINNLQSNDIITVSIDESKIVSADGNYKMSDLLADDSDSSEEGSDEDGTCALDCVGIYEALDADVVDFCAWFTGLGGTGAECFSDCTATFLADLEETCSSDTNDSDATSYTYYVGSLGDYNHSSVLDSDDIDTLITYWGSTRYEYELGPCLGGPCLPANLPNLIPAFDQKWNIEDVMTFYIMCNDANVAGRTLSSTQLDNVGQPIIVYFKANNLIMELPEYDQDVHHI
jgi:hypothetical protein